MERELTADYANVADNTDARIKTQEKSEINTYLCGFPD